MRRPLRLSAAPPHFHRPLLGRSGHLPFVFEAGGDALVRRVFEFAWPYRAAGFVLLLSMVGITATGLLAPWLVSQIVGVLEDGSATRAQDLSVIAALLLGVVVLRSVAQAAAMHYSHVVAFNTCRDLRDTVYAHVQSFSPSWFAARKSGDITKRVVDDTLKLEPILADAILEFVVAALLAIGIVVVLLFISPLLTLVVLTPLLISIWIMKRVGQRAMRSFDNEAYREGQLVALVQDHVSGIKETQVFNREAHLQRLFKQRSAALAKRQIRSRTLMAGFFPTIEGASGVSTALVVLVGGHMALSGELSVASLVAFVLYIVYLYEPLYTALNAAEHVQTGVSAMKRVNEFLDTKPEVSDAPDAVALGRATGHLKLDQVSFAYRPGEQVLRDISLEVKAGETLALVGPTGAGKSTLGQLIARFYDVSDGAIRLDGTDLRTIALKDLRQNISMVLQDVYLFNATLRENIAFGDVTASDEAIEAAAYAAGAHDFITALPQGFRTIVGERGVRLSGGQKQRVAIARAFLKDAPLLILDEATSAVDTETEAAIQSNIDALLQDRTAIVIAHRLSTIRKADKIAVLDEGHLVQFGTHAELANEDGLYARLLSQNMRPAA